MPSGNSTRPVFFDLFRIRQPVNAVVSFGHRVSGVILALVIPVLTWLFQRSLRSPDDFASVVALFEYAWMRAIVVLLIWALAHHALAGIRHLLFDIHVGTSPPLRPDHLRPVQMRRSAWAVLIAEVLVVLLTIVAVA